MRICRALSSLSSTSSSAFYGCRELAWNLERVSSPGIECLACCTVRSSVSCKCLRKACIATNCNEWCAVGGVFAAALIAPRVKREITAVAYYSGCWAAYWLRAPRGTPNIFRAPRSTSDGPKTRQRRPLWQWSVAASSPFFFFFNPEDLLGGWFATGRRPGTAFCPWSLGRDPLLWSMNKVISGKQTALAVATKTPYASDARSCLHVFKRKIENNFRWASACLKFLKIYFFTSCPRPAQHVSTTHFGVATHQWRCAVLDEVWQRSG